MTANFNELVSDLRTALEGQKQPNSLNDPLAQTKLYERWLRQDEWRLFSEAVPLILGCDPEIWPSVTNGTSLSERLARLRAGMLTAVEQGHGPKIKDRSCAQDAWEVTPTDAFLWASKAGIVVPEAFENLARFILTTVRAETSSLHGLPSEPAVDSLAQRAREQALGAAVNLLAKCPEKCRDDLGFVSGVVMAGLIKEQSVRWFDVPQPPLAESEIAELIDKCLE